MLSPVLRPSEKISVLEVDVAIGKMKQGMSAGPTRLQVKPVHCGWLMCVMLWWGLVKFPRIGAGAGWWMSTKKKVLPWHVAHTGALSCWSMQWRFWKKWFPQAMMMFDGKTEASDKIWLHLMKSLLPANSCDLSFVSVELHHGLVHVLFISRFATYEPFEIPMRSFPSLHAFLYSDCELVMEKIFLLYCFSHKIIKYSSFLHYTSTYCSNF